MATKAQVRNKALKKLQVLEEGESPTNEVISDVEEVYDELHRYLLNRGAVFWDSDEEIPDECVRPMVVMLAAEMADDFGVNEQRYQRLQVEAYGIGGKENGSGGAFQSLMRMAHTYVYKPTVAEYL